MTLGEIISALEKEDPLKIVMYGFSRPDSYRGWYDRLAFKPERETTVGEMLKWAKGAVGKTYCGWKGGEFTMDEGTECYVANVGTTENAEEITPLLLNWMLGKDNVPEIWTQSRLLRDA